MRFREKQPPRVYTVGHDVKTQIADCGAMTLEHDEQVTFTTPAGAEHDVTRKDFGFYATQSLNGRMLQFGLHGVLTRSTVTGRFFVMLVEDGKRAEFDAYVAQEQMEIVCWLDSTEALEHLRQSLARNPA